MSVLERLGCALRRNAVRLRPVLAAALFMAALFPAPRPLLAQSAHPVWLEPAACSLVPSSAWSVSPTQPVCTAKRTVCLKTSRSAT